MTYHDHNHPRAYPPARPRPLIEQIPDYRDELDVSDEEDAFYARDDDFFLPPKVQAAILRTTDRIPRRIKRHCILAHVALPTPRSCASWTTPRQ
jgi:hypothetical protein